MRRFGAKAWDHVSWKLVPARASGFATRSTDLPGLNDGFATFLRLPLAGSLQIEGITPWPFEKVIRCYAYKCFHLSKQTYREQVWVEFGLHNCSCFPRLNCSPVRNHWLRPSTSYFSMIEFLRNGSVRILLNEC